jgi:chromosome segregation ATPase
MLAAWEQPTGQRPSQPQNKTGEQLLRPPVAERPKTAVEVMQTMKTETETATAWSDYYDTQAAAVDARIAAVDDRLNKVVAGQSSESSMAVQAEYRVILAERQAIKDRQAQLNAMKKRLQEEYQPLKSMAEAGTEMKASSEEMNTLKAREQSLKTERPALQSRLDAFEAQTAPREAQLLAQRAALEAQTAERAAAYAIKRAELQDWTEKMASYLPMTMDKDMNVKPEYKDFVQQYSNTKGWIAQVDAFVAEHQKQIQDIGNELGNIKSYRSGLQEALAANAKDTETVMAQFATQAERLRTAEQTYQMAVPGAQQSVRDRMTGSKSASSSPSSPSLN